MQPDVSFSLLDLFSPTTIALSLAAYVYICGTLMVIARKTGTGHAWLAWVPFLNLWLMCWAGRKSAWWVLLLLIPFVNVVMLSVLWAAIARARGKAGWIGGIIIVPFVGLVVPAVLAAGPSTAEEKRSAGRSYVPPAAGRAASSGRPPSPRSQAATAAVCPHCGMAVEPGDTFCGNCGQAVPPPEAAAWEGASQEVYAEPAVSKKKSHTGLIATLAVLVVLIGGIWYAFAYGTFYTKPARSEPVLPDRMAGTLREFPVDTDPTAPAQPSSVVTQIFQRQWPGQDLNVPDDWLPPGVDASNIAGRADAMTSTQYHTPGQATPVSVHVVETTAGRAMEEEMAGAVVAASGGERAGIQVQSPRGDVYRGSRIRTLAMVVFILVSQRTQHVVIIYAPDAGVIDVAARLAANVGNGEGLNDYPAVRDVLWTLPPTGLPGLALERFNTFTHDDFERALAQWQGSSMGSDPEMETVAQQARRLFPNQLTVASYRDQRGEEWGMALGDFGTSLRAWTTWVLLKGLIQVGGGGVSNDGGVFIDTGDGRLFMRKRGPYVAFMAGPSTAQQAQLADLIGRFQY